MLEAHATPNCGHETASMTACCGVGSFDPAAEGVLSGPSAKCEKPALADAPFASLALDGLRAVVRVPGGDPPPPAPRYRLLRALLL